MVQRTQWSLTEPQRSRRSTITASPPVGDRSFSSGRHLKAPEGPSDCEDQNEPGLNFLALNSTFSRGELSDYFLIVFSLFSSGPRWLAVMVALIIVISLRLFASEYEAA